MKALRTGIGSKRYFLAFNHLLMVEMNKRNLTLLKILTFINYQGGSAFESSQDFYQTTLPIASVGRIVGVLNRTGNRTGPELQNSAV
jgi:hypothetical protein